MCAEFRNAGFPDVQDWFNGDYDFWERNYGNGCHTLGWNLSLVGLLLLNGEAAFRAGVDQGVQLVAQQMQEDRALQELKKKQDEPLIMTPNKQLVLPGFTEGALS